MPFRLRHRADFHPLPLTHSLSLRVPRLSTPLPWHWSWPLQSPTPSSPSHPSANGHSPSVRQAVPLSPVSHAWISAIRVIAVEDDANFLAFVAQNGTVALIRPNLPNSVPIPLPATPPPPLPPPAHADCLATATTATFFHLQTPAASRPRPLLAVGYLSGAIAIYNPHTASLLAVTTPHPSHPIRHLRYARSLHHPTPSQRRLYPSHRANSALVAIFAPASSSPASPPAVARLRADEIATLLSQAAQPAMDARGAGWTVWPVPVQHAVLDAAVCGSAPAAISDFDQAPPSAPVRLAVAGLHPSIAAFAVTSDAAFSARAAAKRAASSVLSAARGFLFSRIVSTADAADKAASATEGAGMGVTAGGEEEEVRSAVMGVVRHTASWADDPSAQYAFSKLVDVRGSARKAISAGLQAGLSRTRFSSQQPVGSAAQAQAERESAGLPSMMPRYSGTKRVGSDINPVSTVERAGVSAVGAARSMSAATVLMEDGEVRRQRSTLANDEVVAALSASSRNFRIVERLAAAPPPCSLLATSDTLGRIMILDPRDMCVLRVLKGYRDADVAWVAEGGPLLVVHATRLDVLELHGPLEQKRREAFRIPPGSVLVQSTSYHAFCVFPDGRLFELHNGESDENGASRKEEHDAHTSQWRRNTDTLQASSVECDVVPSDVEPADYELTGSFVGAVHAGRASRAVECLQQVEDNAFKVTHLMAMLLTCTANVRSDVHVALASKAGQIASRLRNPDLLCRFEAHRRLAEAFGLIEADFAQISMFDDRGRSLRYGPRLVESELGERLEAFALSEEMDRLESSRFPASHDRDGSPGTQVVTCERFILSHYLKPTEDLQTEAEYEILPRKDLSEEEGIWLAKAYFLKLLEPDSVDIPTAGREHPTAGDVFLALTDIIGLTENEVVKQFVTFFLNVPLLALLNTPASTYASPLKCAIVRVRSRFSRSIVDSAMLSGCENTTMVANAVLLLRLYEEGETQSDNEKSPVAEIIRRLDEVLMYRKLVSDSEVTMASVNAFTASVVSGRAGEAERQAVLDLIGSGAFERARKVLDGEKDGPGRMGTMGSAAAAKVSEAALLACRKQAVVLMGERGNGVVPENVITWIRETDDVGSENEKFECRDRGKVLRELRAVLLTAHGFIPDSSVNAVRSLQLAEAMSALIELEAKKDGEMEFVDCDVNDSEGYSQEGKEGSQGTYQASRLKSDGRSGSDIIDLTVEEKSKENGSDMDVEVVDVNGENVDEGINMTTDDDKR